MRIPMFLAGMFCAVSAYALQDTTVPEPESVVHHSVTYKAQNFGKVHGREQNGGYIQAYDMITGARLWEKKIYDARDLIGPFEQPHDVFIARLEIKGSVLFAVTDYGHIFAVPLFYTDRKLDAVLNKNIEVKGTALNFVDCAGVFSGEYVYLIDGMKQWPIGYEGNHVIVTGTLERKPLPVDVDVRTAFRGNVDAFAYTLVKADWEANEVPARDKQEINKQLDPQYRNVMRGRSEN